MSQAEPTVRAWRELVAIPVFLTGVAAFLLVYFLVPVRALSPAEVALSHIQLAEAALEQGDFAQVLHHAQAGWERVRIISGEVSRLRYLLGCAYWEGRKSRLLNLSESDLATRARADLEAVLPRQLSEAARARWALNLAEASAACNAPPEIQVPRWEEAARRVPAARPTAYARLVDLYLRLEPPQLAAALDISERWLMLPDLAQPDQVRLIRGQLLLHAGEREAARQTLARITPASPQALDALDLRAKSHFDDGALAAAARCWEELLEREAASPRSRRVRYFLGWCYLRLDLPDLAKDRYRPLLDEQEATGEKTAAMIRWAIHQADGEPLAPTVDLLREALSGLAAEPRLGTYLAPAEAMSLLRPIRDRWLRQGHIAATLTLIEGMRSWTDPGETDLALGEAHEVDGRQNLERAEKSMASEAAAHRQAAYRAYALAAEAFTRLDALHTRSRSDASWSRRAARNWLRAREFGKAAPLLETELKRPLPAEQRTELLLELAEALHGSGQVEAAMARLRLALNQPGVVPPRARYLLALMCIEARQLAEAEAELRELVSGKGLGAEVPEVQQGRFALGYVLYWQGRFGEAAKALEAAVSLYPKELQSWTARYWWAEALRQEALLHARSAADSQTESARDYFKQLNLQGTEAALALFQRLSVDVQSTFGGVEMPGALHQVLRDSRLGTAQCFLGLGRASEALSILEALALECSGTADELPVLMHLAEAQLQLVRKAEARQTLSRLREQMNKLPEEAFMPPRRTKNQWLEWLGQADRSAQEGN